MRELLFKNLTSQRTHRRILCMSEVIAENGVRISTQRRCTYVLKNRFHVKNISDLKDVKKLGRNNPTVKRHVHVIRKCDTRSGENKLLCKVEGLLYVVTGNYVHLISFTNSFKIGMKKACQKY